MKKSTLATVFFFIFKLFTLQSAHAQEAGISLLAFVPQGGEVSFPVSPLSFRGAGFNLSRLLRIESGGSLYRFGSLSLTDTPLEDAQNLTRPSFGILAPLEFVFGVGNEKNAFALKAGGVGILYHLRGFDLGNLDRSLAKQLGFSTVNTSAEDGQRLLFAGGWRVGASYTYYIRKGLGINLEAHYQVVRRRLPVAFSFVGVDQDTNIVQGNLDYGNARLNLQGWEFGLGILFSVSKRKK